MNIGLNTKLVASKHVKARELSGEMVLLDLKSGTYYGLDAVGVRVWQLLLQKISLQQICDQLLEEYDVARDALEHDVLALANQLHTRNLVNVAPD